MAQGGRNSVSMVDVAREAGVSLKTVSRVVNEPEAVRPATREAVHDAMNRLGFRANYAARSLKLGKYRSIGLVLFDLVGGNLSVLNGIATAAAEQGYAITLIKRVGNKELRLADAAQRMAQLPVDGMIFNMGRIASDFCEYRSPKDLKTVIITPTEHATCSTVSDDQEGAARMACKRLIELGHRQIRFVAGPKDALASMDRERGWRLALAEAGLEATSPLRGDWNADSGYEAGALLANDRNCTAILASNDNMANGVMCALLDAGRKVPEDVSIIGIDDSLAETVPHTTLSSVRFDHHRLGESAFEEVVSHEEKCHILIQGKLVERDSIHSLH